jgi:hypothetical protein
MSFNDIICCERLLLGIIAILAPALLDRHADLVQLLESETGPTPETLALRAQAEALIEQTGLVWKEATGEPFTMTDALKQDPPTK